MKLVHSLAAPVVCPFLCLSAAAQSTPQFGLQVGIHTSTVRYRTERNHYGSLTTGYQIGMAAGVTSNLSLTPHWSLAPGLRYLRTGFTTTEVVASTDPGSTTSTDYKSAYSLDRVELPVDVLYFFDQSRKGFFLAAGVNVGVLLGGRRTVDITTTDRGSSVPFYSIRDDIRVANTYPLGTTAYYLQRWDAGLKAGLGYTYNSVALQAFYRLGVANIATNSAIGFPSPSSYSRLAELQVAYFLNK